MVGCPNIELHIFCDGSLTAYGAVAYARFYNVDDVHCSLIMSKSRQTPINNNSLRTVPCIELNAAKLAVCLRIPVVNELRLEFGGEYFWSDSQTVLKYIRNDTARYQRLIIE